MAPKAIKKMSIDIAGARLGVAVMTAAEDHAGLKFTTSHAKDGGKVCQPRVCGTCGEKLETKDIVKQYAFPDGTVVAVDAEDFEYAAAERSSVLGVVRFVPRDTLTPAMTDKSYYLIPIGCDDIAYASLAAALARTGTVGIATGMLSSSERLFAIVPVGSRALALQQLNYAEDIRQPEQLGPLAMPEPGLVRAFEAVIEDRLDVRGDLSDITDEFTARMQGTLLLKKHGVLPGRKPVAAVTGTDVEGLRRVVEGLTAAAAVHEEQAASA